MDTHSLTRVSVIVPVYNPGTYIEQLIVSLTAQTLPQRDFEVLFVDDGSTDDTPHRLDRLAAERENVTVLHEPNSGWPGRPRNIGIDCARGEYVFFVDHDDWLGVEALDRMTRFAAENDSDIVIGRQAGHRRSVAKPLFVRTLPSATIETAPLMSSLTPHMMFRRAFLDENHLRFPEGRRRLEDHVFVTRAYFLANRISVLADYHCYFHVRREDDRNAAFQRIDPASYYGNVREVVDVVLAHTGPGKLRDDVLRRSLASEVLGRLDGRHFLELDGSYRRQLFDQARAVAVQTMPLSVDAGLASPQRVRVALLREDRIDGLVAYVQHELGIGTELRLLDLRWNDDGALTLDVAARLVDHGTGQPWSYRRDGEDVLLTTPGTLDRTVSREAVVCTADLHAARLQIVLRRREDSEEWDTGASSSAELQELDGHAWLSYRAAVRIDPLTLGGGRPLTPGIWDVYGRITQTGWGKETRLGAIRTPQATSAATAGLLAGQLMVPYWTDPHGNLSLHVRANAHRLVQQMQTGSRPVSAIRQSRRKTIVQVTVPLFVQPAAVLTAKLLLTRESRQRPIELDASVSRRGPGEVSVCAELPRLARGEWQVLFALDTQGWGRLQHVGASLLVSALGRVSVVLGPAAAGARTEGRR